MGGGGEGDCVIIFREGFLVNMFTFSIPNVILAREQLINFLLTELPVFSQ